MLKRVKIQGYKSLADVEVHLQPLTVLSGPNASGKSNFLDALQLLSRIATSDNIKYAFEPPYNRGKPIESFTFGPDGVPGVFAQGKRQFSFEVDVELSQELIDNMNSEAPSLHINGVGGSNESPPVEKYLRYHLVLEMLPKSAILQIADESLVALDSSGIPKTDKPLLDRKHTRRDLEPTRGMFAADSVLTFLFPSDLQYWYVMRQEFSNWLFFYLEPRERMRMPTPAREVHHIGLAGEDLAAFLNTLQALDKAQFQAVEKALHVFLPSITGINVEINNVGDVDLQLMKGQTPISDRLVSEGTLRILGLLTLGSTKEPTTLLCFEEPETGIHPDRLDLIASLLTNLADESSQVIVTTHSAALLDLLPETSLYIFRLHHGNTVIEPFFAWKGRQKKRRLASDATASEHLLRGEFYA